MQFYLRNKSTFSLAEQKKNTILSNCQIAAPFLSYICMPFFAELFRRLFLSPSPNRPLNFLMNNLARFRPVPRNRGIRAKPRLFLRFFFLSSRLETIFFMHQQYCEKKEEMELLVFNHLCPYFPPRS